MKYIFWALANIKGIRIATRESAILWSYSFSDQEGEGSPITSRIMSRGESQ